MAPTRLTVLGKRDATLSAGDVAGIIVGIVVVALILLGILIWKLLALRRNSDLYSAKSLESRARVKALSQTNAEHVRSTRRPRKRGASETEDGKELFAKGGPHHEEEGEEVLADDVHGGRRDGDSLSNDGTAQDDDRALAKQRLNEKRMDHERDIEIHPAHHATAGPTRHRALYDQDGGREEERPATEQDNQPRQGVLRGCTTM
jgi:hypothetical protein